MSIGRPPTHPSVSSARSCRRPGPRVVLWSSTGKRQTSDGRRAPQGGRTAARSSGEGSRTGGVFCGNRGSAGSCHARARGGDGGSGGIDMPARYPRILHVLRATSYRRRSCGVEAMTDLASLRIAEDRNEWAVKCELGLDAMRDEEYARGYAAIGPLNCAPHRVVSRRVIVTQWADADE